MNLATKLTALFSTLVLLIVGGMNYFVIRNISVNEYEKLNNRLSADSLFAANRISEKSNFIKFTTEAIAKIPTIPIALDLYESRGVNQVLNNQISIYDFIHYILVLEIDGTVFAASTANKLGEKLQGEQLLLLNATEHPLYPQETSSITNGPVDHDPYLDIIGKAGGLSQWYVAPIEKKGVLAGWIVLSTDWANINLQLLNSIVEELSSTGNPISGAFITDKKEQLLLSNHGGQLSASLQGATNLVRSSLITDQSNLLVQVSYDPEKALQPIHRASQNIILTTLLGAVILGLTLYIVIRRLVLKPLGKLNKSVQIMGEGNLQHRVEIHGRDEVSSLGHRINQMASSLGEKTTSIDLLNREVELRKAALKENQEQEQELTKIRTYVDNVTDNVPQFLAYVDSNERYQFVNSTYLKWLNQPMEYFVGLHINEVHSIELYQQLEPYIKRALSGESVNFEVDLETGKVVNVTYTPDVDERNNVVGFFSSMDDITKIKEAENAMRSAKQAAEDSMLAKSQFLASMSHEIRTPMNGVFGMLSILKRGELSETQERQVSIAQKSANSLLNIINDILDFSKIDADKLELENIDFNLQEMIDTFAKFMTVLAEEKELELIVDTTELREVMVKGDPVRIQQILQNLIGNAIKFTKTGEVIVKILLKKSTDTEFLLHGQITDTGIGIPEDKLSTLFDSFTQADASTTRQYGGTGLGLAISKKLVALMGGGITASSRLGKGSTFEFTVSLQKSDVDQPPEPKVSAPNKTIAIIDNNTTSRNVLANQLHHWGFETLQADGPTEAKRVLTDGLMDNPVSMILIDLHMPGANGLALAEELRTDEDFSSTPIVLMTSISDAEKAQELQNASIQGAFPKPLSRDDLLAIVTLLPDNISAPFPQPPLDDFQVKPDLQEGIETTKAAIKILLVEDNSINQEVATTIIKDRLEAEIDIANNGREAIDALIQSEGKTRYDLILMDCQMPEMDGFLATKAIRDGDAGDNNKNLPIIAMTANAMAGDKEKCISAGMNDYISKPVEPGLLAEKIVHWT